MTAEDDKKDMGDKIKLIGRWNNVLDIQTVMVLGDEEARAVGRKELEELANAKPAAVSN